MQTISKLSDKCKSCSNVDNCDNKRMVACAMKEFKPNIANAIAHTTMSPIQPVLRIEHPITINIGYYGTIDTSLEDIADNLNKDLYKDIFNVNCSFIKS